MLLEDNSYSECYKVDKNYIKNTKRTERELSYQSSYDIQEQSKRCVSPYWPVIKLLIKTLES